MNSSLNIDNYHFGMNVINKNEMSGIQKVSDILFLKRERNNFSVKFVVQIDFRLKLELINNEKIHHHITKCWFVIRTNSL